jgi:RNA polymerase sigma-70 factor (ECF subfamily)
MVERLYRDAGQQLLLAAYALTGDHAEAQDAVQEAFVRAFAHPSRVVYADNPVAWMRTVTLNIARDRHRRRHRLKSLMRLIPYHEPAPEVSPDRVVILEAVKKLPDGQREAIALHYLADLSVEDTAEALHVSLSAAKSRLARGRRTLAELLGDREINHLPTVGGIQ